ncbi:MAG: LPXTG cell wall anchor domain-containing protein [Flavobacteriaceae bacterium]|nr:LPXTG cell wall anchor domain-containing protein [Flavobacteriaceae bacterium]
MSKKQPTPPKFLKFFEIAYLGISVLFLFEAYLAWKEDSNNLYIFIGLALAAIFMFFFRRNYRKKRGG